MSNYQSITDYFSFAQEIIVYKDQEEFNFNQDSQQFDLLIESLNTMCADSKEMPAFGVSLHNETLDAMQSGIWMELKYDKIYNHNEMPFSRLLIQVNPEFTGFNIIRFYKNQYEGRCFYLDLNNNMKDLYQILITI